MERDFMGLNSKDTVVKEEALEVCKEPGSFEAFNNNQTGEIQSAHSMQIHEETKHVIPVTMSSSFFRPQFAGSPVNPQLLGGVPVIPSTGSFVARSTEPWYSSKATSAPAQLTIFYGGMVNVYDEISPEKAQVIMFLAGNDAFVAAANPPHPRAQAHAPAPTPMNPAGDAVYTQPGSVVSSPMSMSSHPIGVPANRDEAAKTMGGSATLVTNVDTPRIMTSFGQVMQSAIPQARKASLARFLEKRKERMMASVPYSLSKNSSNCVASSDAIVVSSERRE